MILEVYFYFWRSNMKITTYNLLKRLVVFTLVTILFTTGISRLSSVTATVPQPPVADANGPYTGCVGESINFDGSGSYDPDGTIVSYQWDFGDGDTGSGVTPSHTYDNCEVYTVTLTVTDNDGLTDTDDSTVEITCCTNLVVDKKVWNGTAWVDEIRVVNGTLLNFQITIINDGNCPLDYFTVTDYLSTPQLKYQSGSAEPAAIFESDHEVQWLIITPLNPGQTIVITYNASAVHFCYGWNSVYVKDCRGTVIGYDFTKVKVIEDAGQPVLALTTMVWDDRTNKWSDHVTPSLNKVLTFKITVSSTALSTVHDVTVSDMLPSLITYNDDATPAPDSVLLNEIFWNLGDISTGDESEIIFTVTTLTIGSDYATASVISDEGYSDEAYVLLETDSAPDVSLLYPVGGEIFSDIVTIQWYASDIKDGDDLPISLYYKVSGDTLWMEFPENPYSNSGQYNWDTISLSDGSYQIQIVAQDSNNNVVNFISNQFQILNTPSENLAPDQPGAPSGSTEGKPGQEYTYSASTVDPERDQIYYLWDWGDGTQSEWIGPCNSGETISTTHIWAAKGSYCIKVMAKDINDHESNWSDPLPITMPYSYNPLHQFFEQLFERFPNAFPILRQMLGY